MLGTRVLSFGSGRLTRRLHPTRTVDPSAESAAYPGTTAALRVVMRHLLLASLVFACACGRTGMDENDVGPDASAGTGDCQHDADCEAGKVCVQGACVIGGGCGQSTLNLTPIAPNLLFVLDRSCSMKNVPNGATKSKWGIAVDGVEH